MSFDQYKVNNADFDGKNIQSLTDNKVIGRAEELKRLFDAPAQEVLAEKFNALLDGMTSGDAAGMLGAEALDPASGTTIQEQLEFLNQQIAKAVLGQIPKGTITDELLSNGENEIKSRFASLMELCKGYAPGESPVFTGMPKAPTPEDGNDSTRIATTEFVKREAAPSKYGLGEEPQVLTDLNLAVKNGWYALNSETFNRPTETENALVFVTAQGGAVVQRIRNLADGTGLIRFRQDAEGDWIEEWITPPNRIGEEYRICEFYQGKPVYVKIINCGAFPASSAKEVNHGIAGIETVVRCEGRTSTHGGTLPWYDESGAIYAGVSANANAVIVTTTISTWTKYQCEVTLYYTKEAE